MRSNSWPLDKRAIFTHDQRRFIFSMPDHPSLEIHLTIILSTWGPVVTYIWEKQPLF